MPQPADPSADPRGQPAGRPASALSAAGGVLWRHGPEGGGAVEVAVVHRPKYDDWSLPKGKLEPGERWRDAAAREVWEETGYRVLVGAALGSVSYLWRQDGGRPRRKVVEYWAMEASGGGFRPNREVDRLEWLPPPAARERLTHDRDRGVLDVFVRGRGGHSSGPTGADDPAEPVDPVDRAGPAGAPGSALR